MIPLIKIIWKFVSFSLALFFTLTITLYFYYIFSIYSYAHANSDKNVDAAIVLGAAAWGNRPSPVFKERINHAINLYKANRVNFIIFTGGKGFPSEPGESVIARRYAIKNGVPEEKIFIENISKNTEENIYYAKKIASSLKLTTFFLVSDPYHLKRASVIAGYFDMDVYPAATPTTRYRGFKSQFVFLFKEAYIILLYQFENITGINLQKHFM